MFYCHLIYSLFVYLLIYLFLYLCLISLLIMWLISTLIYNWFVSSFVCFNNLSIFSLIYALASWVNQTSCGTNNGGCQQKCHNDRHSFRCSCENGYHIDFGDPKSCTGRSDQFIRFCRTVLQFYGCSLFFFINQLNSFDSEKCHS